VDLLGKISIVVGGAGGIGKSIVQVLLREGAYVNVVDIKDIDEIKKEMSSLGEKVDAFSLDISSKKDVINLVQQILNKHKRIDILVNAAGVLDFGLTEDIGEDEWDRTMAVNLKGPLFFCQAVIPIMKKQRSGKIVSIGSLNGKGAGMARADYKVSKAGVHALTMAVAQETAHFNINVNAIAPNLVLTSMSSVLPKYTIGEAVKNIPLGRAAVPEDISNAVFFLVSEKSSYITGHVLDLNGGAFMG